MDRVFDSDSKDRGFESRQARLKAPPESLNLLGWRGSCFYIVHHGRPRVNSRLIGFSHRFRFFVDATRKAGRMQVRGAGTFYGFAMRSRTMRENLTRRFLAYCSHRVVLPCGRPSLRQRIKSGSGAASPDSLQGLDE